MAFEEWQVWNASLFLIFFGGNDAGDCDAIFGLRDVFVTVDTVKWQMSCFSTNPSSVSKGIRSELDAVNSALSATH
jgi:hypothetical protein